MKKVLFFIILVFLSLTSLSSAQTKLQDYKKIDYINVRDGQLDSFLKTAKKELLSKYQQLIDSGVLKSWELYHVKYPGGKRSGYDLISIATASDIDSMEAEFSNVTTPSFIPDNGSQTAARSLAKKSSLIKSELWEVENFIQTKDNNIPPSKYLTMDYMKVAPGKNPDYLMLEDEIAKPIHKERIKRDNMAGWEVYSLITPGGTEYGYNFCTVNYFDNISDIQFGFTNEIIKQSTGNENANISELFNTIYSTRDQVKVELWKLVIHTN